MGKSARAAIAPLKQHKNSNISNWLFDPSDIAFYDDEFPQQDSAINPCREESLVFFEFLVRYLAIIYKYGANITLKSIMIGSDISREQLESSKHCPNNLNSRLNPYGTRKCHGIQSAVYTKHIRDSAEPFNTDDCP